MAIVKERIAQGSEASGSARKHASSVRLPRCPRELTRRYRLCRKQGGIVVVLLEEGGRRNMYGCTHCFFVVCVRASAVSPDVVYADDHGEHGKENGAERGGLRKGADVLRGVNYVLFFSYSYSPMRGLA